MNSNKMMAGSLFLCSIAMIIGLLINVNNYWFVADIFTIIVCQVLFLSFVELPWLLQKGAANEKVHIVYSSNLIDNRYNYFRLC
jgi:hydrogenase-4 membrane subunit HyfE